MSHQSTMHETLAQDMVRTALLRLPVTFAPEQLAELVSRVALTRTDTGLCNHQDEKCCSLLRQIPLALTASQVAELVKKSFPEGRDPCDKCREQAAAAECHDQDLVLIQAEEDNVGNAESSDNKPYRTPLPTLESRPLAKTGLAKMPPLIHTSSETPRDACMQLLPKSDGEDDTFDTHGSSQEDVSKTSNQGDTPIKSRYHRLKREGKCVLCARPRLNSKFVYCESCHESRNRRYRQKLKDGQCTQCSKPREDARNTLCSTCRANNKASRDRKMTMGKVKKD